VEVVEGSCYTMRGTTFRNVCSRIVPHTLGRYGSCLCSWQVEGELEGVLEEEVEGVLEEEVEGVLEV